jgi:hypothetical protein
MPRRKTPLSSKALPPETVPLNELEYKFDDCPVEELYDCWSYEFARESEWMRAFVTKQNPKTLKELARSTIYSFLAFPQWPTQPYLSIEKSERQRLLLRVRPTEKELEARFLERGEVPEGIEEALRAAFRKSGRSVLRDKTQRREMALFLIDWQFPDRLLLRFFESYLKLNRPSSISPTDNRARNSPDAHRRQELKYLGMFRLLRLHSNAHAAHKAFGQILQVNKVDAWYRARKSAKEHIKLLNEKMINRIANTSQNS